MALNFNRLALAALLVAGLSAPAAAQSVEAALTLTLPGDAEQHTLQYDCGEFGQISVAYINAAPNFLALVPYEGKTLIFAAVLAASGVRYTAANYEWWTKGAEVTFRDLTNEDQAAPPLATCSELTETP